MIQRNLKSESRIDFRLQPDALKRYQFTRINKAEKLSPTPISSSIYVLYSDLKVPLFMFTITIKKELLAKVIITLINLKFNTIFIYL